MYSNGVHASFDYLFARLHGLWSSGVNDIRLEHILQSGTLEGLQYNLKSLGIDCSSREGLHDSLISRVAARVRMMFRTLSERDAKYYMAFAARGYYDDLAAIFRRRFFPNDDVTDEYIFSKRLLFPTMDVERLLGCRSDDEFVEMIPLFGNVTREKLGNIVEIAGRTKELLPVATEVRRLYFSYLLEAAGGMSGSMVRDALKLVREEIDMTNLSMLMRSVRTYHLSMDTIRGLWVSGGGHVELNRLGSAVRENDFSWLIRELPEPYRHLLEPLRDSDLYLCENALWNHLYHTSLHLFHAFDTPHSSIVAFPYLNLIERENIERIYEAVRLGMPTRELREMLIS